MQEIITINGEKYVKYMFPSMIFYIKSQEIADKIIKEHQEDLKLIFDI